MVLDSVTSAPQCIRQPSPRVYLKEGSYHTRLFRGPMMRTVVVRTMVVRVALTSTLSYRPNFLGTPTASFLQEKCARSNQNDTKTHMKLCTARENMRNELQ